MALIQCPECGKEISDKANSCPQCGYSIEKMQFCKFCGEKIPLNTVICTKCGKHLEDVAKNPSITINNVANATSTSKSTIPIINNRKEINKWVSFILCLVLGCLGAHKFYEGKTGMGILYLCTGGLLGFGWIIDTISILFKPNPYYV